MSLSEEIIQKVWERGRTVMHNSPDVWRTDQCDAWIKRTEYGNRNSQYGWEVDHISPTGGDDLSNLRPLQWKNNLDKREGRLKCNVTAQGTDNIDRGQ
jgi:hypothetical protein